MGPEFEVFSIWWGGGNELTGLRAWVGGKGLMRFAWVWGYLGEIRRGGNLVLGLRGRFSSCLMRRSPKTRLRDRLALLLPGWLHQKAFFAHTVIFLLLM